MYMRILSGCLLHNFEKSSCFFTWNLMEHKIISQGKCLIFTNQVFNVNLSWLFSKLVLKYGTFCPSVELFNFVGCLFIRGVPYRFLIA